MLHGCLCADPGSRSVATLPNDLAPLFFFFGFCHWCRGGGNNPLYSSQPFLVGTHRYSCLVSRIFHVLRLHESVYLSGTCTIGYLVCQPSLYCFSSMPRKARRRGHVGVRHVMWAVLVSNAVVGVGSPGISLCSLRYESSPAGAVPFPLLLLVFRSRVRERVRARVVT